MNFSAICEKNLTLIYKLCGVNLNQSEYIASAVTIDRSNLNRFFLSPLYRFHLRQISEPFFTRRETNLTLSKTEERYSGKTARTHLYF